MDKRQENYLVSVFFEKKLIPVPEWYRYVFFLISGVIIISGIINLIAGKIAMGLLSFVVTFGIHFLCYYYWRHKVLKIIGNMKPEQLENLLVGSQQSDDWVTADLSGKQGSWLERWLVRSFSRKKTFPTCKKCEEMPSLINVTV
ncbi:MAG: hypothetical protein AUJ85_06885 [Elusimicrobia bacterium CG1_02_37_114]|nr:MAG: hypothetical protein AUJ85_06885 [Elusimicrobia bacterium CG1_02_37_114]PIV52518.1 MAG: hypothetical protein COS17_08735 [Elusimicrobia bacterium CG02_land_8_20_14_3_00_37_13]PIZ13765.1 MAG: hypothetical protein COY53_03125 [Elusimicrobia bacterium CG_4_10_14_0_8_um_filter_37_32]